MTWTRLFLSVALAFSVMTLPAKAQNVLFIVDFSGSMNEKVAGIPKIVTAKKVFRATLQDMPTQANIGLMIYGHRRAKDCKDIELIAGLGQEPLNKLADHVDHLKAKGETPIATALLQSLDVFAGHKGESNSIVLITDGREECNGDPCAATQALVAAGVDVKIHVVGFNLSGQDSKAVECITRLSGGSYYDAKDAAELKASLEQVTQVLAQAPPPAPPKPTRPSLIAKSEGGELLAAAQDVWQGLNDGKEDNVIWLHPGEEGVYGFKDGRAATFDTFTMFIGGASPNNVKDFELFAGDESPTGSFRSLGQFTAQNMKLMNSPYQEFKFEKVTAKFFKVKLISNYNNDAYISAAEFQLFGEVVVAEAPPAATAAAQPRTNVLAQSAGGELLAAPQDIWRRLNDGKEDNIIWLHPGEEGVYGFKDGQPATFDTFTMFIGGTGPNNVKDFELFAGDESPTGNFRSLGTFTAQNTKLMKSPYQEFKFEKVTAKFFKVKLISNYNNDAYISAAEFQLFGEVVVAETPPAATATGQPRTNVLAQSAGGELLAAAQDVWQGLNDGKEDNIIWLHPGEEGVYGFKDGRAATFDTFTMFIGSASPNNVKDFELFAGDESPTGSFRSLGQFTAQNMKLMNSPYQEFKFEKVTAKFFKVKLISNYNNDSYISAAEFQLFGEVQ